MTLSKQLFSIITFIFIMIFVGNFIITVNSTKDYLEQESSTKAQDTAVSLGMILKTLISDKKDPEIKSTITIISDSGFYKSIVLEDSFYTFNDRELLNSNKKISGLDWNIKNVRVDKNIGNISISSEEDLENQLNEIEDLSTKENYTNIIDNTYTFLPSKNFKDESVVNIYYDVINKSNKISTISKLKLSKKLVEVNRKVKFDNVPQWFINFIDLNLPAKKSEINDGWKTSAIIYVTPNPGIAYEKLYEQLINAFYYSLFALFIAIILLYLFLYFVLKPLKNIENLALKISNGQFEQINDLPWTTELNNVSLAMNNMSHKIHTIINNLNNTIKSINNKLSVDNLTKLPLKQEFETDIKKLFIKKSNGYVYLVKISNLSEFAQSHGQRDVDNFIKKIAVILNSVEYGQAYRFFGSEFVIIFNNITKENNDKILKTFNQKFDELSAEINKIDIAHIGVVSFNQYDTNASILTNVSEAYEMAKQVGPNMSYIKNKDENAMGAIKWREIVKDIISNEKFNLKYIGDISVDNKLIIQEAFANIVDKNNNTLPIGTFISVAQENNLAVQFDKIVIKKIIEHILKNNVNNKIIINLSSESISNIEFLNYLENVFKEHKLLKNKLVFSLTAYSIGMNKNEFKNFSNFIKVNESNVMIKRYETKFISIEEIRDIKPNIIRLSRDYTNDITLDDNKKYLVESIAQLSSLLDIEIYSEHVNKRDDYDFLKKINIYVSIN